MDERLKFIARVLDGEKMAALCREFGISRKTGYKLVNRYNDSGLEGLTDRSRRPYRHANQLPFQIEKLIVRAKQDKPSWGAPKIRERLARRYPMSTSRRSRRCMRFWTDTGWSSIAGGAATGRRERRSRVPARPMICGVPITRASSCWPTGVIAIR